MLKNGRNIHELITYSEGGIVSKELFKAGKLNSTLFCMAKGTELTEHTSTKEGTVYVVEGNGTFILEGEKINMKTGVLIYMKKNAVHALKTEENTSFILSLYQE